MTNRLSGIAFERELCSMLAVHGFWVHNIAQTASGQPADIIAVKNGRAYLIDCKVCANGKFDTRRIEENQDAAMCLWRDCGNGVGWFALKLDDEVRIIPHSFFSKWRRRNCFPCFDRNTILEVSQPFNVWVKEVICL